MMNNGGLPAQAAAIKSELSDEKPHFCAKCEQLIRDRYFLRAVNLFWHEDCLKCVCCNCRLIDVGATLYTRENFVLCRSDYMRLYGNTGLCAACNKMIPAFEMVMRAKRNVYHLECFACQQCTHRFCVGDRFYLYENRILCEADYAERLLPKAATNAAEQPHINTNLNSSISSHQIANNHSSGSKSHMQASASKSGDRTTTNFNLKSLAEFGVFGMRAAAAAAAAAAPPGSTGVEHHVVVR